jgi:hypothetical protein
MLLAAMGETLKPDELETFRRPTGGREPSNKRAEEFWGVVGRRGEIHTGGHPCRGPNATILNVDGSLSFSLQRWPCS